MTTPRNLLAVRFGRLGDVILLLDSLAGLKTLWPDTHLVLLTDHRYEPLAKLCPFIDEIIPVNRIGMRDGNKVSSAFAITRLVRDLRRRRFAMAIDFHGFIETQALIGLSGSEVRVGLHRQAKRWMGFCFNRPAVIENKSFHVAEMFRKVASVAAEVELPIPKTATLRTPAQPPTVFTQPIAGFYTGAGAPDRMWPAESFARLADLLSEKGFRVVLFGGNASWEIDVRRQIVLHCINRENLFLPQLLSTAELVAAISRCRILVSNDTGPMHIGPAVGVPTVGLFSVGFPEHYRPYGAEHAFVQGSSMDAIRVQEVSDRVFAILDRLNGPRK